VLAGALDGRQLRTRHPQRRMRFLDGFRHHVAQGYVKVFAVMFAAAVPKHREDGADGLLEHFLLGFHVAAERRQFGDRGAFAHAEFAAAVAQEIEHRDALGDAGGMIGGELENAVAEPDVFGALGGCGKKRFRRRRMRIFFQKMMFHHPGMIVAAAVGGLQLRQRILVKFQFAAGLPRARQLQLIKDAEFHAVSPAQACCFRAVYSRGGPSPAFAKSSLCLFRAAEAGLHETREWLALRL
jgi:hypothetical protein